MYWPATETATVVADGTCGTAKRTVMHAQRYQSALKRSFCDHKSGARCTGNDPHSEASRAGQRSPAFRNEPRQMRVGFQEPAGILTL